MYKNFFVRIASVFAVVAALALPLSTAWAEEIIASGTFKGASNHVTTGGVKIVKSYDKFQIILEDNFSLDGAPDPKVGFGKDGEYDGASKVAPLKNLNGHQVYEITASVDVTQYNEVYIWCEKFSVPLGVASIK